ncbi:serine/threonine-protein kinase [Planomonospora corallina]|uniref:Serine/threonine-protein kinase n=1 Tax=Planomonospora corallina TaxID=1806052 RepID=A0ABV8I285_9ACTN
MNPLLPGDPERLGRYRLLGRLGEGGQGTVYLAQGPSGTPVAVKALHLASSSDPDRRRRFAAEAELIRQVSSFCVAEVLDAELDGERPFIVSEYVDGPSLRTAVDTGGPRTGGTLRRLAVGTVTALAAIHQAGIVHRDFKPPNVLLGPDGPRVIDFGIARLLDTAETTTGQVIGTVAYMSPEQVSGARVGFASDMFSWASTMAYAAGGRPPFGQDAVAVVMYRILHAEPGIPALPDDLREVVAACLDRDPERRPSARDVLMRLIGEAGAGGTVTAPARRRERTPPATAPSPAPPAEVLPPSPAAEVFTSSTAFLAETSGPTGPVPAESTGLVHGDTPHRPPGRTPVPRWVWGVASVLAATLVTVAVLVLRPGSSGPESATGELLYHDDFGERGGWDGYTFDPGAPGDRRTVRGYEPRLGVYSIHADATAPSVPALSPVPAKTPVAAASAERDVLIGVTARVREGSTGPGGFGLLCRWDEDVPDGYLFLVGLDGTARVVETTRGTSRDVAPAVPAAAPRAERPVHLRAACRRSGAGTRLTLWIDGALAVDTTDSSGPPAAGNSQAGLVVRVPESTTGALTVSFDDFTVHRAR